jgi:outer membrane autotransporter protein
LACSPASASRHSTWMLAPRPVRARTTILGLYGGKQWGPIGFRAGAAYTWHDIKTSRFVSFPDFADRLDADYYAADAQVFGELGYKVHLGSVAFEPFFNLAHANLYTDGFAEDDGGRPH